MRVVVGLANPAKVVGNEGVEPSPSAPKAGVLPLYQFPIN